MTNNDPLIIAGKEFSSRLLVGTGKYKDFEQTKEAIEESGAEIVTVALRRVNVEDANKPMLQDYIDPKKYTYLPNTAGCFSAEEAVRTLRLAKAVGGWNLVKLEVLTDPETLMPEMDGTIEAAKTLVAEGFDVMVYCTDDTEKAKQLEEIGCCAIMPLAAPIGTGLGILHPEKIEKIVKQSKVPVLVDAGIGTPSDAVIAMELGCAGVLLNTALSAADDPVKMASAMKHATIAGRLGYLAGRMPKKQMASPSSPTDGVLRAS